MFEIKTLKDGLKKIAPRTKTKAITDDANKNLDTILSEKANSADVPSKVSQLTNDTGFITNAALANYPNNTQMNAAINAHHDSTKQDKLAAQTPYTNVGSKNKIPKITTNALGQVTNVEEIDIEDQRTNLSQNLTYANDNNTTIVTNVSDDLLLSDGATYIEAKKSTDVINNGLLSSVEKAIARFSKDYFSIKNTNEITLNIDNVLKPAILRNCLSDVVRLNNINNMHTGITISYRDENLPVVNQDTIIISGGSENNSHIQCAITNTSVYMRTSSDGINWLPWNLCYINKQDKLTFAVTDFNVKNNTVSLNPTKFADYLTKAEAKAEAQTRETADNDLSSRISSNSTNITTNATAINDIKTKLIPAESSTREKADANLQKLIEQEKTDRETKDKALQEAIDNIPASSSTITVDETNELIVVN